MNTLNPETLTAMAILGVLVLLLVAAWLSYRRRQSYRLEQHFGAEYRHVADSLGSRDKAEAELRAREERVRRLHIVPLAPDDAQRFSSDWTALQARFVDSPEASLMEADRLVRELMQRRGYPMGDFERRAADISVDHPRVVEHLRAAQGITQRAQNGQADTEELRRAVMHYRALFDELLEVGPGQAEVRSFHQPRQVRT
jgi:hypothetical protein